MSFMQKRVVSFLIIVFALSTSLIWPHFAFADVLDEQLNADTQILSNSFNGSPHTSIAWPVASSTSGRAASVTFQLIDKAAPADLVVYLYSQNGVNLGVIGTTTSNGSVATSTYTVSSSTPYLLDASQQYFLYFYTDNGTGANQPVQLITYSGGEANRYMTCGDLQTVCEYPEVPYFILSSDIPADTSTHIISVTPANGDVVATSTTFSFAVTGYVNPGDYTDGMQVVMDWGNRSTASQNVVGPIFSTMVLLDSKGTFTFPISSSGLFSFSTTTNMQQVGDYNVNTTLIGSAFTVFGVNFGSHLFAATSTLFTVATTTEFDRVTRDVQAQVQHFSSSACSFSNFQVFGCLSYLIIPSTADMRTLFNQLYDIFFKQFPFGYVTRFITVVNGVGVAPVMPPALTYTFGSSSPAVLQGDQVAFQIWEHTDQITAIRSDDGQNKSIWDIVDPYFTLVTGLAVVLVIVTDLMQIDFGEVASYDDDVPVYSKLRRRLGVQRKLKVTYEGRPTPKEGIDQYAADRAFERRDPFHRKIKR